jgi:glycine cleavage system aminomethyltransferase T
VQGFEINLLDGRRGDDLWDAVFEAGEEFDIRPVAPVEARRIEAGIFNYGSDMTLDDTPLHLMGLERLVENQPQDYVGKAALESLKRTGVDRKLVGIEWSGDELRAELTWFWPVVQNGAPVGKVTDAVWSPKLERNIGYAWVPIELAAPGTKLEVESEHGETLVVTTAEIPFVDAKKEVPAASLT